MGTLAPSGSLLSPIETLAPSSMSLPGDGAVDGEAEGEADGVADMDADADPDTDATNELTGACTASDEAVMNEKGGGHSAGSFPAISADCGKSSYSIWRGFSKDKFVNCL